MLANLFEPEIPPLDRAAAEVDKMPMFNGAELDPLSAAEDIHPLPPRVLFKSAAA